MGAFAAPLKAILYLFALYVVAVHINILVHLATTNDDDIAPTKDDIKFGVDKEAEAAETAAAASEGEELVPPPAMAKSDPPSHTTTTKLPSPTLNSPEAQQQAVASISPDGSQTIQTPLSTKKPKKKRGTTKLKKVIKPPPIIEQKIVTVVKKEKQRMVLTNDELKELRDQMVPLATSKAQETVNKVQDMMTKHTEAKSLAVEVTLPTFRRQHEEFFQHFHKKEHPPHDTELELMERHYDNMLDITKALSLQTFANFMEEELVTIFGDAISRLDGMVEKIMNDELLDDDLNTMFGVTGKMIDETREERSVLSSPPVCDVSFLIPPEDVDHRVDDTDTDKDGAAEVFEDEEKEKEVKEVEVIPPDVARESDLNNAVGAIERTIRHRLDSLSDVTSPLSSKGTENVRFLLKDRATAIWKERMAEEKAEREALLKEKKAREMELMKNMDCCVDVEEVNLLVEEGIDALFRKKDLVVTLTSLVLMLEEEMGGGKYTDDDDDDDAREGGILDMPLIPLDDGGAHDASSGEGDTENVTVRQLIDTALLHKSADGIDYIVENLGGYIDLLDMAIDQIAGDGGDGDSSVGKASIAALMDVLDRVQIPNELRSVYVEARGKAGILWNQV